MPDPMTDLDESRQLGADAGLGLGDEAGCVLLHQPIPRDLLRAMAFVLDWNAIGSPLGLLPRGLHDGFAAR
jgi:hypothetical protein